MWRSFLMKKMNLFIQTAETLWRYTSYLIYFWPNFHKCTWSIWILNWFQVWRVDGGDVSLLSIHDKAKLFSGDCYIVQYKYTYNERNEYLLYVWIGCESMEVRRLYVAFEFCFFSTIICELFLNDLGSVFFFFFTSLHCRKIELMPYLMLVPLFLQPRVNL